jgi:DNA-binding transcriptional ArsR family regulator
MSYHLRSLEKAGIVERADSTGDGRERPWRRAGERLKIEAGDSAMGSAASTVLTKTVLARVAAQLDQWVAVRNEVEPEWRDAGGVSNDQLWLTPDELAKLGDDVRALFDAYDHRDGGKDLPDGARSVRVGLYVVPLANR